jgi:hypothetical protein
MDLDPTVSRQENGACAASRDCLVSGNIVQKDDLSLLQSWSRDLFDIGQEVGARGSILLLSETLTQHKMSPVLRNGRPGTRMAFTVSLAQTFPSGRI